jgi:hypothetical protein
MHDDFNFEPIRGLPAELPPGEEILWQGSPNPLRLAKDALGLYWVIGYFAVLAIWRVGVSAADLPMTTALGHGVPFVLSGIVAGLLLVGIATIQARSTVYTLTNKRACMRIGAALSMTLNLPYVCIGSASAAVRKSGLGTVTFQLSGETRLSYLMTWPHVRPWYFSRTQPAFRAIPDAARVAAIFSEAAETRLMEPKISRIDPDHGHAGVVAAE